MKFVHIILLLFIAQGLNLAIAVFNLASAGCVDVSDFKQCQNAANAAASLCTTDSRGDETEVWECEHQEYMIQYLAKCPQTYTTDSGVPYFPAPDNVSDACSCNLGNIFLAGEASITQMGICVENVPISIFTDGVSSEDDEILACHCCGESGVITAVYEFCPSTDPTVIGLNKFNQLVSDLGSPFSQCNPYLSEYNCISDLNFSTVAGATTYLGPSNLPVSGTATLSNVAGTVTSPASGTVFTYTNGGDGIIYTISAASVNAKATGTAKTANTAKTSSKGTTGSDTASSTSAGATKSSAGEKVLLSMEVVFLTTAFSAAMLYV